LGEVAQAGEVTGGDALVDVQGDDPVSAGGIQGGAGAVRRSNRA